MLATYFLSVLPLALAIPLYPTSPHSPALFRRVGTPPHNSEGPNIEFWLSTNHEWERPSLSGSIKSSEPEGNTETIHPPITEQYKLAATNAMQYGGPGELYAPDEALPLNKNLLIVHDVNGKMMLTYMGENKKPEIDFIKPGQGDTHIINGQVSMWMEKYGDGEWHEGEDFVKGQMPKYSRIKAKAGTVYKIIGRSA